MKPRGPKESELVAVVGARLVAGYTRPCLEAKSCAQSCASVVHNLWDARVPARVGTTMRPQFFSRLNQFCERRLGWLSFCFEKAGVRRFF